jgi:hypothetical protein
MRLSWLALALLSAGCAAEPPLRAISYVAATPKRDSLFTPERVVPGRLEYAPDRNTFAPILSTHAAYPTQRQANFAYIRGSSDPGVYVIGADDAVAAAESASSFELARPASVALFACKPGALDELTGRVERFRGPVVHCATDFFDGDQHRMFRATANFAYVDHAWTMQITHPPQTKAAWLTREPSPTDRWWWVPGRDRYQ